MLLRQGEARSDGVDRRLACILAAIAGALNTAAFHAVGFFSANMTGNVSSLSDHAAAGEWWVSAFYLSIVLAFVFGASVSTLLINAGRRQNIRSIYAIGILAEAILMVLLGGIELLIPSLERGPVLILGLSFLMGIQNAVVTRISDARVRTTHISGMSTDIGIELSMLFDIARGRELNAEAAPYRSKLRLHLQTVVSFLAGGIAGVVIYQAVGTKLLFCYCRATLCNGGKCNSAISPTRPAVLGSLSHLSMEQLIWHNAGPLHTHVSRETRRPAIPNTIWQQRLTSSAFTSLMNPVLRA